MKILKHPHPMLHYRCHKITKFDRHLHSYAAEMVTLMREHDGWGLAAPQVGLPLRMFVCEGKRSGGQLFINPLVIQYTGKRGIGYEGCLSMPDVQVPVARFGKLQLTWQDLHGRRYENTFEGVNAVVIQHEYDHLNGITILDKAAQVKDKGEDYDWTRLDSYLERYTDEVSETG